jgi:DNA polymerase-3 subunit delta'
VSGDEDDDEPGHPRATQLLFGHAEAEAGLLSAYRGGRMPHAFLIGGAPGIGKATLAYRMARFVLAHPDPAAADVQKATSLAVDPQHPVVRRMAAQGLGDLLVLQRTVNEQTGKLYTVIRVDEVRRTVPFFGSTAGEGGWRVCIVDTADELQNPQASNALLKVLEEPPPRALFLLVSNAPARLLPTIRSRCRRLMLRPLEAADVARATAAALGRDPDDAEIKDAAAAAEGSVGRAIALMDGEALTLRKRIGALLDRLPETDARALHALGESIAGTASEPLEAFVDAVNDWLSARLTNVTQDKGRLVRMAEAWETINRAALDADTYNLERKPLVFSVFGLLAEAACG